MTEFTAPPPPCATDNSARDDYRLLNGRNTPYKAGYDSGLRDWGRRNYSPFQELSGNLNLLTSRAQAAYRNNGWLSRAIDVKVTQEIGTGIVPRPHTGNHALDRQLRELWRDAKDYLDFSSVTSVYGLQQGLVRGRHLSGDGFCLIHNLKPSRAKHLPIPVQFQNIDASMCPYDYHVDLNNGHKIIHGVEINQVGQVVAYHFHKSDPELNAMHSGFSDLLRVTADKVIHHFIPKRAGQLRAVPEIIKGIPKAVTFEKYNDAELERKGVRAALTGVVEKPEITAEDHRYNPITGDPLDYDHSILPESKIETGTFLNMLAGEKVNLFDTDDAGRGYHDYQKWQLLAIASATNTPYQLISGDFEGINDRLWRAIFNDMKRHTESIQYPYIVPQICRRMWNSIVDRAILTGQISVPSGLSPFAKYRVKHQPQSWEYIQPLQDVQAKEKEYKLGFTSRATIVDAGSNEESIEELDEQRALDYASESDKGIPSALDDGVQPFDPSKPPNKSDIDDEDDEGVVPRRKK